MFSERLEEWLAGRLFRRLERRLAPLVEDLANDFLRSVEGRKLLADLLADALTDLLVAEPGEAAGGGAMLEELILRLVRRLAARPGFRVRLAALVRGLDLPPE
ncbi:MAG: hypothetical protein M0Z27_06690 [Thermaerobacter sp.]|nr:hypothetical protein [Thermaerobacter sp.]